MTWPLKIVKIQGHSMQPLIKDGQLLFVNQWAYLFRRPRIGEVVVFRSPGGKELFCKRITAVNGSDYILHGDNPADSLDSRALGAISIKAILGRVV